MKYKFFIQIGEYIIFLGKIVSQIKHIPKRYFEIVIQFKRLGNDSIFLITVTAAFTGLVTALQAVYQTRGYIPIDYLGVLIGKSTMIELGPVLTALVLTGKVGASIAAELGTMQVSEQIDALRSMSIKPESFLYLPRVVAGIIMFPIMTIYANVVGILVAWSFSYYRYEITFHTFFSKMRNHFYPMDLWGGLIKSAIFGLIITSMGCFYGSKTYGGAEGVGQATMQTVVVSAIMVLVMDFTVAWFLFGHG